VRISIIGLGYVGYPLAESLSQNHDVTGYDINNSRISFLKETCKQNKIKFTNSPKDISDSDVFIVTVPTPVNEKNLPDMSPLKEASELIGSHIKKSSIVIYESTVYPGATEEYCVPIIEEQSGLTFNKDFSVAYSPERIDPGNKINTLKNTIKLVSASNKDTLDKVISIYEDVVTDASLHVCESIRVCEAAKAVENIQRDVNIALMNELSIIFNKLDIPTRSVIEAASTKWNFGKYHPGLVGGHCIGVDPYYVIYKAEQEGINASLIKNSRKINDGMVNYVLENIIENYNTSTSSTKIDEANILFLGITFKENCGDTRNSQPQKLASKILKINKNIHVYDPWVDKECIEDISLLKNFPDDLGSYELIIKAVNHEEFMDLNKIIKSSNCLFIDLTSSINSGGFSLY
jgi:UDP-N-acetyl-D-glucosamine/UDP-N-acetyl-D-galactosamine dehydrogenase